MKKRLGGRPSKLNATTRRTILRLIRLGLPYCHACAVAKISFQTFCNWRSENERFHSQVKEAIAKGVAARLVVIERVLKSKDESMRIRSAHWLLEHTPGSAEHFSRSHVELTGPDDKPLV